MKHLAPEQRKHRGELKVSIREQITATPAYGLDIDFSGFGGHFTMPGFGSLTELVDALSGPVQEAAPAKIAKLDHTPSFQPAGVPAMRM
jgi:hypothetical protein